MIGSLRTALVASRTVQSNLPMVVKAQANALQLYRGGMAEKAGHLFDSQPALPKKLDVLPKLATFSRGGVENSVRFGRTTGIALFNTMMKFARQLPATVSFDAKAGVKNALAGRGFSDDDIRSISGKAEQRSSAALARHGSDDPGLALSAFLNEVLKQVPGDQKAGVFADVMAGVSGNLLSGREAERRTAEPDENFYAFRDSDSDFAIYYLNEDQMTALAEVAVTTGKDGEPVFDREKVKEFLALPGGSGAANIYVASPREQCEYIVSTLNPMQLASPDGDVEVRPGGLQQSQIPSSSLTPRRMVGDGEVLAELLGRESRKI